MTSLLETESLPVVDRFSTLYTPTDPDVGYNYKRQYRHVLNSKENTYKHKCNRFLRNKLKKYKRKRDGTEDPDVLNVSKILVSSLIIKSPSHEHKSFVEESNISYFESLQPKNYLFKMVRKREGLKTATCIESLEVNIKKTETADISNIIINEEKKHTNAFQLLMDSRNKSIGTNSPGKEQNQEQIDSEEIVERKNAKAKRNLLLQNMAEAKGYHKNKELEEKKDEIIKKKMNKRAENLKTMILKEAKQTKLNETAGNSKAQEINNSMLPKNIELTTTENKAGNIKQPKVFKIVDIFNTYNEPINESSEMKYISKEDKEFLRKLSPSLQKKESMLSYFRKIDKSEPGSVDLKNDNLIKVKLQCKPKKKGRNKKRKLKMDTVDLHGSSELNNENHESTNCHSNTVHLETTDIPLNKLEVTSASERQKRKWMDSRVDKICDNEFNTTGLNNYTERRPRRSIKKPMKYTEDICLSSSDEDLHIFTPKKKKKVDNRSKDTANHKQKKVTCNLAKSNNTTKKINDRNIPKKPVKLAPIFSAKQLDPVAFEAKQKFLQSGVPDKLKKIMNQQNDNSKMNSSGFAIVIHVQQKDSVSGEVYEPQLNIFESDDDTCLIQTEFAFKNFLNLYETCKSEDSINIRRSVQVILQKIKELHPKFPVYRTYNYLRGKCKGELKDCEANFDNSIEVMRDVVDIINDSPERLNWTDKYKPMSTNHILGNFESIKELRKWLVSWTENQLKSKTRENNGSDSSDFYHSDNDSRDSLKTTNNLLILTGPTGCGKTSSVYAVAAELAMKVIEVNASGKRTGKIMLQDLQEATQSHKVNRGTSTDSSQKSQERSLTELLKKNKKRGRPKKSSEKQSLAQIEILTPVSQESTKTDMSLILIDDADIVFDQDDGFSSAIIQLVQCSKRPVILITSSLIPPHLQRFLQSGKILKMSPLLPRLLGTWLDIMCLADNGVSWPGVGAKFLDYFKGDIRKTINYLQFYISGYTGVNLDEQKALQNNDYYKTYIDEENSGMSWAESNDLEGRKLTLIHNNGIESNTMWTDFVNKNFDLTKYRYPLNLFNIWWSLPHLLALPVANSETKLNSIPQNEGYSAKELEVIADVIDAISLSDNIDSCPYSTHDITAQPWYSTDSDSMSEQNNMDYYMRNYEIGDEIGHALVTGCILRAQDVLNCERKKNITFPGMSMQRKRDKVVSRHTTLSSFFNPWVTLDRRSLAMDYWSSCRTICRLEKSKNDGNVKRNNRFCHYLKSLSVLCKSDMFGNLCDSLSNHGTELNITNYNEW